MKKTTPITRRYTPRQYFQKLIGEGYDAYHASSLVNAEFGGDA